MSSKRGSMFEQGKKEDEYIESHNQVVDPAKRATAAQLAARKIKQPRKALGKSSAFLPKENPSADAPWAGGQNPFASSAPPQSDPPSNPFGQSTQPAQFNFSFGATQGTPSVKFGATPNVAVQEAPFLGFSSTVQPQLSFGTSTTNTQPEQPKSSFNLSGFAPSKPLGSFGTSTSSQLPASKPEQPSFNFGGFTTGKPPETFSTSTSSQQPASQPKQPSFGGFGASQQPASQPEQPSFSFGVPNQQPASQPEKPSFSFGVPTQQPASQSEQPPFSFGVPTQQPASQPEKPSFSFGVPTQQPASQPEQSPFNFSAPSQQPPFFGTPTTDQQPASQPEQSLFNFSAPSQRPPFIGTPTTNQQLALQPEHPSFGFNSPSQPPLLFGTPTTDQQSALGQEDKRVSDESATKVSDKPMTSAPSPPLSFGTHATNQQPASQSEQVPFNLSGLSQPPPSFGTHSTTQQLASQPGSTPKARPDPSWAPPVIANVAQYPAEADELGKQLMNTAAELSILNRKYREKLATLSITADWTALSQWHARMSSDLIKKMATLREQRTKNAPETTANIFGSVLSKTATPQLPSLTPPGSPFKPTPKAPIVSGSPGFKPTANAPTVDSSSGFKPAAKAPTAGGSFLSQFKTAKTAEELAAERKAKAKLEDFDSDDETEEEWSRRYDAEEVKKQKAALAAPGFQLTTTSNKVKPAESSTPAIGVTKASNDSSSTSNSTGFKPSTNFFSSSSVNKGDGGHIFGTPKPAGDSSSTSNATGFKPSTNFFDSSSINKGNGSVKSATNMFGTPKPASGASTSGLFSVPKPTSGASTSGLFSSRSGSPAASSPGGGSVFDDPQVSSTATPNIFGHLHNESDEGQRGSRDDDDEDDDDEDADDQAENQSQEEQSEADQDSEAGPSNSGSKRKLGESDTESDGYIEDAMRRKRQDRFGTKSGLNHLTSKELSQSTQSDSDKEQATPKPSLASRMTRTDPSELNSDSEKTPTGLSTSANGGAKKSLFPTFNFGQVPNTAPGKSSLFAGDQTFKHTTPIKFSFGSAASTSTPAAPSGVFTFSPTPTAASTAFGSLAPNVRSSAMSTRAPTPMSADEASGKESTNDDANEGGNDAQLTLNEELTPQEKAEFDVLFSARDIVAKHQVVKSEGKTWETKCRGSLWMMQQKDSRKVLIRIRLANGSTPLNFFILPKLKSTSAGASLKMVLVHGPDEKTGKPSSYFLALKNKDMADEFSGIYNSHV